MDKVFSLRLPEELLQLVDREAAASKSSSAKLVRGVLEDYFKGGDPNLDSMRLTIERLVERLRVLESHTVESDESVITILQNLNSTVSDMRDILQETNALIPKTFFRNTEKVMLQLLTNSFYQNSALAPVAGADVQKLQGQALAARNEFLQKMKSE